MTTSIQVRVPSALIQASSDDPEVFAAVWSQLPETGRRDGTAPVARGRLFLKRQRDSFFWWLRHALNPPGIEREVRGLDWMREAGLEVPDVIAWGQQRRFGAVRRSFLLLELVENAIDLRQLSRIGSPNRRLEVIISLGQAVRQMHEAGVYHRELTARNILVANSQGPAAPRVLFIDPTRAERTRLRLRTGFLRRTDLLRLTRSLVKLGASEKEVSALLESAGAEYAEKLLEHVRHSIAADNSHPPRTNLWMIFGI